MIWYVGTDNNIFTTYLQNRQNLVEVKVGTLCIPGQVCL